MLLLFEGLLAACSSIRWPLWDGIVQHRKNHPQGLKPKKPLTRWDLRLIWQLPPEESNFGPWLLQIDFDPTNSDEVWEALTICIFKASTSINWLNHFTITICSLLSISPYMHSSLHNNVAWTVHSPECWVDWFQTNCVRIPTDFHPGVALWRIMEITGTNWLAEGSIVLRLPVDANKQLYFKEMSQ